MKQLRDYQVKSVEDVRNAYRANKNKPLLVLPTGGGKTFVFCFIAEQVSKRGKRVYILVHRSELLYQTIGQLTDLGVEHGAIAPSFSMSGECVQVASVQTLVRRLDKLPEPDLIIVDEGHHAMASTWLKIIAKWPKSRILGVTATPCRMDGKGLGDVYDEIIIGPTMRELIKRGHLCDYDYYAPPIGFTSEGIKTIAGDYDKKEVADRMDKPVITGCAIDHYNSICPSAPAIAFCTSVAHAQHVAELFRAAGYTSECVDGTMSMQSRKKAISGLGDGSLQVLTSCDIVSEGTDIPIVKAAILLRPTKSTALFLQQVGRVLRPAPGKGNAVILDHVGNYKLHGMPDDDREWSLDGYKKPAKRNSEKINPLKTCDMCYSVYEPWIRQCPKCGHVNDTKKEQIKQIDGRLEKIERGELVNKKKMDNAEYKNLRRYLAKGAGFGLSKTAGFRMYHRMKNKEAV